MGEVLLLFIQLAGQQSRAVIMDFRAEGSSLFPRDSKEQSRTHDPVTSGANTAACSLSELRVDPQPDFSCFVNMQDSQNHSS